MLTVKTAIELGVRHALRGARPADELEELHILRMAWSYMLGLHAWSWLRNRNATIDIVGGQQWLDLPADCAEVVSVHRVGLVANQVMQTTIQWIVQARAEELGFQTDSFWWALEWEQDRPDEESYTRLAIYPAQPSSLAQGVSVVYHGGRLLLRNGAEDSGVIPLPGDGSMDMLFIDICRAIAAGYERDTEFRKEALLAEIAAGPTLMAAKRADANRVDRRTLVRERGWLAPRAEIRGRPHISDPIDVTGS